jgi:hypothetical protein
MMHLWMSLQDNHQCRVSREVEPAAATCCWCVWRPHLFLEASPVHVRIKSPAIQTAAVPAQQERALDILTDV